ncbi:YciI family protein [Paenisporosarcina cavernae]|uniref:YCII-related domain-containing protein n=1 Tax=Paenisporosarcina cavernae TaxID=2320858 RepID=A0A385YUI7_9BACL|nr:YciI family protein [Paenisporosarcina cavernae]AYC30555.1 hypothetical protein D3873_12210 [Paenisporosarcina cavernae]
MKFICMGYLNPEKMDARPEAEIEEVMNECAVQLETFFQSGKVLLDVGLEKEVKSLSRKNGQIVIQEVQQTNEAIGSVFMIEAQDMEEAIKIASLHPTVQVEKGVEFEWRIEIHPIHFFQEF